jgi:DNA-3-methyladenine glycosylase
MIPDSENQLQSSLGRLNTPAADFADKRLPLSFYTRTDVVEIARDLLGKLLYTSFDGQITAGIITETEAYRAPDDRACHAFGNRRTPRTEVMFAEGGRAYIYLCYGMHHLFNIVTGPKEMAHAVLIRAIEPVLGRDVMVQRRQNPGQKQAFHTPKSRLNLTTGPGALSQALGLYTAHNGQHLLLPDAPVQVFETGATVPLASIVAGKRIGVDYAGACAEWPWRFWLNTSPYHK